jgi:spore coat polysaccharide biosynthesis predicted glycosyltransferase SpsG/CMP-N-acetylneuraminic acid synthetase
VTSDGRERRDRPPVVLVIIPARGGSKGIARKNLRTLGGRPLIAWAIATAQASRHDVDVVVSSNDDEVLSIAAKLGAINHRRRPELATDSTTLDATVVGSHVEIAGQTGRRYDVIVTMQPTSPLLRTESLDASIDLIWGDPELETVLSVVDDTHLTWSHHDGGFEPLYAARVNRQQLPRVSRETGGLIVCLAEVLASGSRIGRRVAPLVLSGEEAVDIDTPEDWALCEWYLGRREILFVVAGYPEIGLGHVRNVMTIADDLVRHRVRFLVTSPSELAEKELRSHHFEVHRQADADLAGEILSLKPDVVINDRLDTGATEIRRLRDAGVLVVNIEDLGDGAREADLVINAIYPEKEPLPNHFFGPRFFCMRHEFLVTKPRPVSRSVRQVLVTFGGVDPSNLTLRVVSAIHEECTRRGIELHVIAGRGYDSFPTLRSYETIRLHRAVADMAERIRAADLVFTSAGRTIFEVAALGTPAIVLAQNERELTHLFASPENGFLTLGLGAKADEALIHDSFVSLLEDPEARADMSGRMLEHDLRGGTERVVRLIEAVIGERCASRS